MQDDHVEGTNSFVLPSSFLFPSSSCFLFFIDGPSQGASLSLSSETDYHRQKNSTLVFAWNGPIPCCCYKTGDHYLLLIKKHANKGGDDAPTPTFSVRQVPARIQQVPTG